jgi:hypothetical protein
MRITLFILAIFSLLVGFAVLGSAKGAIHEIQAFVLFVIASILFSSAAIIGAINIQTKKILEGLEQQ